MGLKKCYASKRYGLEIPVETETEKIFANIASVREIKMTMVSRSLDVLGSEIRPNALQGRFECLV